MLPHKIRKKKKKTHLNNFAIKIINKGKKKYLEKSQNKQVFRKNCFNRNTISHYTTFLYKISLSKHVNLYVQLPLHDLI